MVADITIIDKKDGFGTSNIYDAFKFVSNRIKEGSSPNTVIVDGEEQGLDGFYLEDFVITPDELTNMLSLGIDGSWQVMDGENRRGFLVFELPDNEFTLQSQFFKDLSLASLGTSFSNKNLLTLKTEMEEEDQGFADAISTELEKVIRQYGAEQAANSQGDDQIGVFNLIQSADKFDIPFPMLNGVGARLLAEPQTLEEVLTLLRNLAWRPSYSESQDSEWLIGLSPQAVLTQGWGTEAELTALAEQLLSRIGIKSDRLLVNLTKDGKKALASYLKLEDPDKLTMETLPALTYRDTSGKQHLLVIPFMREISELGGGVYLVYSENETIEVKSKTAFLSVNVKAIPIGDARGSGGLLGGGMFDGFSDAIGGGDENEDYEDYEDHDDIDDAGQETIDIELLSEELDLTELSKDAIDIGFGIAQEEAWTAFMETPSGRINGEKVIVKEYYEPVAIRITIAVDDKEYTHEIKLNKGETLDSVYTTLGINLPELPGGVLKELSQAVQESYKNAGAPNEISALRWYTRNNLYRFIGAQTVSDDQLADDLKLSLGRTTQTRIIAVTVRKQVTDNSLSTSINLISINNQVHNGVKEAVNAFYILSGLAVSRMEGAALGQHGHDFTTIWDEAPEDMAFYFVSSDTAYANISILREHGFPEKLLQNMQSATEDPSKRKMFLIPDMPSKIDGQDRWAWLEFHCETYETIAVLDTGEKGGFAEYLIVMEFKSPEGKDYLEYTIGAMVGVDVGLWSMCGATLVTESYEEAIELAKSYAGVVSDGVHKFFDLKGSVDNFKNIGKIKGSAKKGDFKIGGELDHQNKKLKLEPEADFLGFVNGFDDGLKFYFDKYVQ